jgi:hypothetical protein
MGSTFTRYTGMLFLMMVVHVVPVIGQAPPSDSQVAQIVLTEIRQLRQDLRTGAATIQRVQILMYRHQAQAGLVDKTTQRLDLAGNEYKQSQMQKEFTLQKIEQAEAEETELAERTRSSGRGTDDCQS